MSTSFDIRDSAFGICPIQHLAPQTALRDSAFLQSEASPQVVSAAKDNGRIYDPACGSGPARAGFVQSETSVEYHGRDCDEMQLTLAA